MSVYGGAGGRGTRISSSSGGFNLADGLDLHVSANEKTTMQNLNNRLASYLEKVRTLEQENDQLEKQIRGWYQSRVITSHDYTSYFATIDNLKDKVRARARVSRGGPPGLIPAGFKCKLFLPSFVLRRSVLPPSSTPKQSWTLTTRS